MKIITARFVLALQLVISMLNFSLAASSIVFVHIGSQLPDYLKYAVYQARIFNPEIAIYVAGNEKAFAAYSFNFDQLNVKKVFLEQLPRTTIHQRFIVNSTHDKNYRNGFWLYATERFLYLHDLMQHLGLFDVFHLESDNMLYADLQSMLPVFRAHYPRIAAVFDTDTRCVPGFIYLAHKEAMEHLAEFFVRQARTGKNDMDVIGLYRELNGRETIDQLPILMKSYLYHYPLVSGTGQRTTRPESYIQYIDEFKSVFDGAAFGQYLGGQDPRNGPCAPGFVNLDAIFNVSNIIFDWKRDRWGRRVPYARVGQDQVKVNTLHIHSKQLEKFLSVPFLG